MPPVVSALLAFVVSLFQSRQVLHLRILALQHQVAVYKQTVYRPCLTPADRLCWVWLSRLWPGWQEVLAFVQLRTVIAWQHKRLRAYWRRLSQRGIPGRPALAKEVRDLIRQMWQANPTWGSPRIVGELRKLGIEVAKSTVEKYCPRPKKLPSPTWKTFLRHHVQDLVALDFFVVPTVTCRVLFVLVQYRLDRARKALAEAVLLLDSGHANTGMNRLYYACFYAVSVLLLTKGLTATSHSGLRALFHQHVIRPGLLSLGHGPLYDRLFDQRQLSDYADLVYFGVDEVRAWSMEAQAFVDTVAVLIQQALAAPLP